MDLKAQLIKRMGELKKMKIKGEKFLEDAPEGTMYVVNKGNAKQYYTRINNSKKYIKKSNTKLLAALSQKEYTKNTLKVIERQIAVLQKVIEQYDNDGVIQAYENMHIAKQIYVSPFEFPEGEYALKWEQEQINKKKKREGRTNSKYDINNLSDDYEIYTENGERVRSKSEKILADKLNIMQIPYVYEVPYYLNGIGYVKPDFTVLNKRTRQAYMWEHFGLMDNEDYCRTAIKKIQAYEKNGVFSGKSLIVTFETKDHPMNTSNIENIVLEHLV